jgi:hypothetical protein
VVAAKPRRTPHVFVADPELRPHPADLEQRGVCAICHLVGEPGDAHHTVPEPTADVRQLAAGEGGER